MIKKTAYTLAKMWSEWSSRSWIGMRSATVMEVAEFLDALKDAGMKVERISGHALEYDAEAIAEGWETEETAVSHESGTSRYDISIVEMDEYPVRRSVRIATISFHYTPRSIRNEKVTVYEIDRSITVDGLRTIHYAGGDGDECEWYELPSDPILYTQDWKWFFVEMPDIALHFDQATTDGAFLLRTKTGGKPAAFNTYSEQLI